MQKDLIDHIYDVLKGAVSAALVAGLLAFVQYLGGHIPTILQAGAVIGAGVAGVKANV